MKNHIRSVLLVLITVLVLSVSGCGGGGGSSGSTGGGGGGGNVTSTVNAITIDNAGLVPVIGQSSTTSVIYVHNNSNQTISGIGYSAVTNTENEGGGGLLQKMLKMAKQLFGIKTTVGEFLNPSSVGLCASIPAGQSCPLVFNTPIIDSQTAQGSALITANYTYSGTARTFSQIISYAQVLNNSAQGAVFSSGTNIHGFGNSVGYATVYMYGSGANQIYTVTSITSNKPGVKIVQGNITGKQIQSNYVQAVEISAPTATNQNKMAGYNVTLTATSTGFSGGSFSSIALFSVPAITGGAIVISGLVPIIDALNVATGPNGTLFVSNAGNATATISNIVLPSGVTTRAGSSCTVGGTIAAGASCTVLFSVSLTGGSDQIELDYSGGAPGYTKLFQDVVWYNKIGGALSQMIAVNNPLTFNATVGGSTTITVKNIGGYNMESVTVRTPVTKAGSATSNTTGFTCNAGGTSMPVGESCTFTINVSDSATDLNGAILTGISATYNPGSGNQTYSRGMILAYVSNAFAASLAVTPDPLTMQINGDGLESSTLPFTVTNNGPATAAIESSYLTTNPLYLQLVSGGTCDVSGTGTIAPAGSCTVFVKLGPLATASVESGVILYTMEYSGGQTPSGTQATSHVDYTVQADNQNLVMILESAIQSASGTGESSDPYIFAGHNTSTKQVRFTYQNQGSNPIRVTGVSQSNSPISWLYVSASSSCSGSPVLALNESCTVVFNNVFNSNILAISGGVGASYSINLTVPTLVFRDESVTNAQFVVQPVLPVAQIPAGGTTLYVNNTQATVSNSATESTLTGVTTAVVQNTLANGTGYAVVTVTSRFESYITGASSGSQGNCTYNTTTTAGIVTQTCTLTPVSGVAIESVAYNIDPSYVNESLTLNVLYGISPANQAVSMNPLAQQVPLQ